MQVITEYSDEQLDLVLEATEKLEAHLTAAVVSNDARFTQKVCANFWVTCGLCLGAMLLREGMCQLCLILHEIYGMQELTDAKLSLTRGTQSVSKGQAWVWRCKCGQAPP